MPRELLRVLGTIVFVASCLVAAPFFAIAVGFSTGTDMGWTDWHGIEVLAAFGCAAIATGWAIRAVLIRISDAMSRAGAAADDE